MDNCIEISEDEDDFDERLQVSNKKKAHKRTISISSDEDVTISESNNETLITSDEEDMPAVEVNSRKNAVIRNLFPSVSKQRDDGASISKIPEILTKPKQPAIVQAIAGVSVQLPVIPYPCQKALMSTMITAIKKGKNCLLESPTGSGKTLALLCGALAWQQHERNTIAQTSAQQLISNCSNIEGSKDSIDYVASPMKNNEPYSCQVFNRTNFDNQEKDLVTIHKKQRLDDTDFVVDGKGANDPSTPRIGIEPQQPNTPDKSVPTIYYGARTHKQLEQVIKEFGRTTYCGQVRMTVLSSREYSCIREFDKIQWSNKNDMCRACVKPVSTPNKQTKGSNCKFYDNRASMSHRSLPPAFDLEDLVATGTELNSCPYYAARAMAASSDIVFCPYNYLIDPSIRSSMQIDLADQVVVIDEAHNIEDICRDAATFTFTRDDILAAIKELETVAHYRFANQDVMTYVEVLIKALKNWDEWFHRHTPLVDAQPVNYGEATHLWDVEEFAGSLQKQNIGETAYNEFQQSAGSFCKRLREDPRTLVGVSQLTGSLVESLDAALGYLFRNTCANMEDFKPVLIKNTPTRYNRSTTVSLRLICLNPALVFAGLRPARCVVLASGTLTPHTSLHSELGTEFPYKSNPGHVISKDRVWVGTLSTGPDGGALQCTSSGTRATRAQDALGAAVLAVARRTPHGLLAFLPSYHLMDTLATRWQETGLWAQLADIKHVYQESRNVRDHNDNMDDYYESAKTEKGALLFAVYRGKVSEGMDFKDHQARAVIAIGVPYPNLFDVAVKEKMAYNDRRHRAGGALLPGREWLRVQAYRALNQAAGRCVRHRGDWGAVLLVDARYRQRHYTEHLAKWLLNFLGDNHHTFDSLMTSDSGLASFMQCMTVRSQEDEM